MFCKKDVLTNFTKFTGKHLCWSLFLNKVAGLRPTTLLKKRLWHRCFPANFAKFVRTPFLQNISGWMLLYWKRKPTWRKDMITHNSHPWSMFSFNWLVIIWRGKGVRLELDVQGQGGGRILDVVGQGGWGVLNIGQFSWTSYVYHPLMNKSVVFFIFVCRVRQF